MAGLPVFPLCQMCSCILCCFAFFSVLYSSHCGVLMPLNSEFLQLQAHVSEHLAQFKSALDECRYAWNVRHGCKDIRISYSVFKTTLLAPDSIEGYRKAAFYEPKMQYWAAAVRCAGTGMKEWVEECETWQIEVKHLFMHRKSSCLLPTKHQCACVRLLELSGIQVIESFLLLPVYEGEITRNCRELTFREQGQKGFLHVPGFNKQCGVSSVKVKKKKKNLCWNFFPGF